MKSLIAKSVMIVFSNFFLVPQCVKGADEVKHPLANLSADKVFVFEAIEAANFHAIVDKYRVEQKGRLLQVIEVESNGKLYEIEAPALDDIDPKLGRGVEKFRSAYALPKGDMILDYEDSIFVLYQRNSQKFIGLPGYVSINQTIYQTGSWVSLTDKLLIAPFGDGGSDRYAVYEMGSGKVYDVEVPEEFRRPHFILKNQDDSQGVVEVENYVFDGDMGHDPDITITGSLGLYQIKEKS